MPLNMPIPPVLYHYCSMEALYGIITSRSLWLTDSNSTNDFMENTWATKQIINVLKAFPSSESSTHYDTLRNIYNLPYINFIACLSAKKDTLSQWRGYANDGCGVSIGFNTDKLDLTLNYIPGNQIIYDKRAVGLHVVVYDETMQTSIIKAIVGDSFSSNDDANNKANELRRIRSVLKNPAFEEESEWRIIHTPLIMENTNGNLDINGHVSNLGFIAKKNDLIPYFIFPFTPEAISEVIIGPKNMISDYKLKLFLASNGFKNIVINKSIASYR